MLSLQTRRRFGFTLIELLVVIAIIAVLIALLVPAVQKVRESANRTQCANNMKQLGLAVHNFHAQQNFLPPSHLADTWPSWAVLLLPYLEQDAAYKQWDLSRRYYQQTATNPDPRTVSIPAYFCPSRRSASSAGLTTNDLDAQTAAAQPLFPHTPGAMSDYASVDGTGSETGANADGAMIIALVKYNGLPASDPNRQIVSWQGRLTFLSIPDGTSNTFLFGEKHVRPKQLTKGDQDGSVYNGDDNYHFFRRAGQQICAAGSANATLDRPLAENLTDNSNVPNCAGTGNGGGPGQRFGSYHPGICQFALCDGSVRAIPVSVDIQTLTRLVLRNDGSTVSVP